MDNVLLILFLHTKKMTNYSNVLTSPLWTLSLYHYLLISLYHTFEKLYIPTKTMTITVEVIFRN